MPAPSITSSNDMSKNPYIFNVLHRVHFMKHLKYYTKQDILSLTKIRRFETKLGEMLQVIDDQHNLEKSLNDTISKYVLIGIPEDIGVRANSGIGGTDTAWLPFLQSFLNIQSNDFLLGDEILVLGHFDFGDIQFLIDKNAQDGDEKLEAYRHAVNAIDDEVEGLIKLVTSAKKFQLLLEEGIIMHIHLSKEPPRDCIKPG